MPEMQICRPLIYVVAKELCCRPSVWAGDLNNIQGWCCQISEIILPPTNLRLLFNSSNNSPTSSPSSSIYSNNCTNSNWWMPLSKCRRLWWAHHLSITRLILTRKSQSSSVQFPLCPHIAALISRSDSVELKTPHAYIRLISWCR